jgi:multiple sugar transport system permease protein
MFNSMFFRLDTILERFDALIEQRTSPLREACLGLLLCLPAFCILAVFGLFPLFFAAYLSLYGGKYGTGTFVGLGNYAEALSRRDFWNAARVTAYYAVGTVPLTLGLAFVIADRLRRIRRFQLPLRLAYFLPWVTSAVAAAMVWRSLFHPELGIVNALLQTFHLSPQRWLMEPRGILHLLSAGYISPGVGPSLALCCIMLFDVWHGLGFTVVILLAAFSTLPRELEEAALLDGAEGWRRTWHITLPLLSPTLFFLGVVGVLRALQAFNSFFTLTQGSDRALGTAENLVLYLYAQFYEYGFWGYGAAVATLLSAAIMTLTVLQWYTVQRWVHYE